MDFALHSTSSQRSVLRAHAAPTRVKFSRENSWYSLTPSWADEYSKIRFRRLTGFLLLFIIGFISLAHRSYAQSYVFNRLHVATGTSGQGNLTAAAGDFNQDGKLDLAFAGELGNNVSIMLGKPDATFTARTDYPVGQCPVGIAVADFNYDGKPDLAVANSASNTVSVLLGNGDGTFQLAVDFATGEDPIGVVTADFNGDGKMDIAVANNVSFSVSVLLGNGDGTFQPATSFATKSSPVAFALGDFNGDGKPDLVVSEHNASDDANEAPEWISVFLNKGDGTFNRIDTTVGYNPGPLVVCDFNQDGIDDIIVIVGSFQFLQGHGDGTFTLVSAQSFNLKGIGIGGNHLHAADFNRDGKIDLISSNSFPTILLGQGGEKFTPQTFPGYGVGNVLLTGDFNGDGITDFVTGAGYDIWVFLGNGDGTFGNLPDYIPIATASTMSFGGLMLPGDLNGDGKPDVSFIKANNV